jgi:hypothetical protein
MNSNKLYLAIFLLILLNNFTISESIAIISIPDANLNATAALAFLNNFEKENYLYFSFDFNYHNQVPQKEKNTAYFKLTSELFFSYSDFKIYFLDKKQEEVTSSDIDTKNYMIWEPCYLISKEKINNEYDYYIQIKRLDFRNRKNTVILRVPIYKKEGQITVENLYSLPENILEKKINLIILTVGQKKINITLIGIIIIKICIVIIIKIIIDITNIIMEIEFLEMLYFVF